MMKRYFRKTLAKYYLGFNLLHKYNFTFGTKLDWFRKNEKLQQVDFFNLKCDLLQGILSHAVSSVPGYRALSPSLNEFFLQTRDILRDKKTSLLSDAVPTSQFVANATGGSTGKPTHYYQDRTYLQYNAALALRNLLWTGWEYGEPRVKIWGSSFDVKRQDDLRGRVTNWLNNLSIFPAFDMRPETMQDWYQKIREIRPTIIEGYVNSLMVFARFLNDNNLPAGDLGLKGIITAAETLQPEQRLLLEKTFNCRVFNRYGSREMGCIAHECSHGRMHINEDWVNVEITDDLGRTLPDGELGQIIITHYFNRAMPFIRYAIEDVGAYPQQPEPCSCGLPFRYLERLEGRIQDLIALPNGGFLTGLFFPHLFKEYDVMQYQIIQDVINHLRIFVKVGSKFTDESRKSMDRRLSKYLPGMDIEIFQVTDFPTNPSGKFRSAISHVTAPSILSREKT
jgi:phenylacetate-CoA ligase